MILFELKSMLSQESENSVLTNFVELSRIPRPSSSETQISEFIIKFAHERKLGCYKDEKGNLLVKIPSNSTTLTRGVILQSHLDMVCLGEPDPATNGVTATKEENGWLSAKETTLGADDGIGIACSLSLMDEMGLEHGSLAFLFTVEEETGLGGAVHLDMPELKNYSYMLNLDSEEEGRAIIGSAGSGISHITLPINFEAADQNMSFFDVDIKNLKGGHSGLDIDKGRTNAILLLTEIFEQAGQQETQIASLEGGEAVNSIPKRLRMTIATTNASGLSEKLQNLLKKHNEEQGTFSVTPVESLSRQVLTRNSQKRLLKILTDIPNGVLQWDPEIKGLVYTSSNLGQITTQGNEIQMHLSYRSFADNPMLETKNKIEEVVKASGGTILHEDIHSGWKQKPDSHLVKVVRDTYRELFGKELVVDAAHAGLECGLITLKYPQLEAISLGPTILDVHTITERVSVSSVEKLYLLLTRLIPELGKNM